MTELEARAKRLLTRIRDEPDERFGMAITDWLSDLAARDAAEAGEVERLRAALMAAKMTSHDPQCKRSYHMNSDCPSTHYLASPCTCECTCWIKEHNARIDAALYGLSPRAKSLPLKPVARVKK